MPLAFKQDFTVFNYECDPYNRMSPGAALRRVQEISTAQCESLGFDEAFYQRSGAVFLLSRLSLRVTEMPRVGQAVTIETRAYGMRRAAYHRVTSLHHAQSGQKLCEADTRWVLVDTAARRILRKPLPQFAPYFNEDPGAEEHEMRLPKPEGELYPLGEYRATYSLCDSNGHINNTRYADIICDHLPLEKLQSGAPAQMLLNYHSEIPLSQSFLLSGAAAGQGFYFAAAAGGGNNFEGFAAFE